MDESRQALVRDNLALARWRAARFHRHAPPGVEYDDLAQEAVIGLARAARLFDPALGFRFTTYATRAIDQRLWRWLNASDLIHVPWSVPKEERARLRRELRPLALTDEFDVADPRPGPEEAAERSELAELIARHIALLPAREAEVIRLRFFEHRTLKEAGKTLGVSKERVRQVEARAVENLKNNMLPHD